MIKNNSLKRQFGTILITIIYSIWYFHVFCNTLLEIVFDESPSYSKLFVYFCLSQNGYIFLMLYDTLLQLSKKCMPLNPFHDLNNFIDVLNNEW